MPREAGRAPKRTVGGLVNAVEPVLVERGGCWIGWHGSALPSTSAVEDGLLHPLEARAPSGIDIRGVPLTDREVSRYYHGLSNRALWPLFHSFLAKAVFQPEDWTAYVRVNRRFAKVVAEVAGPHSQVWVQDYHLALVPLFLREDGFHGRIDFFLHIPFPAQEIFRALPWRKEVLQGMLAADTVDFHVGLYRDNFADAAVSLLGSESHRNEEGGDFAVRHDRGMTHVRAVPIGIDVDDFERIASSEDVGARVRRIRNAHGGTHLLFGADRLDYTKGIRERILAVERLLELHPGLAGKITFVQVVVPSRHQVEEYRTMKREIDLEIGRINGRFARESWVPIHYRYASLDRPELVAHYRAADAALVTPLRDGMNLVASEFAASRVDRDGVLLVSEFAGVAERSPGAVLLNPYDIEGTASSIADALRMEPAERRRRMDLLRAAVRANPVSHWAERCLGPHPSAAAAGTGRGAARSARPEPPPS
jgi:alpha,alpha-trehalose-phosphate synthase [UDP-forming]